MAAFWFVVDEHGKDVENVTYIDHGEGAKRCKALNLLSTRTNKFYRLREGNTAWRKDDVRRPVGRA